MGLQGASNSTGEAHFEAGRESRGFPPVLSPQQSREMGGEGGESGGKGRRGEQRRGEGRKGESPRVACWPGVLVEQD